MNRRSPGREEKEKKTRHLYLSGQNLKLYDIVLRMVWGNYHSRTVQAGRGMISVLKSTRQLTIF